jgi:hypothetical protein
VPTQVKGSDSPFIARHITTNRLHFLSLSEFSDQRSKKLKNKMNIA